MQDTPQSPETMRAVKVRGPDDLFIDPIAPVPTVRPGHLLIKVFSVALNPADWKRVAIFNEEVPHLVGCDVAGYVVACGEQVIQDYKPGDRVAGLCYGMKVDDPTSGAFAEYALLKGALSLHVPDHVSDLEAATIPVGANFVGQALYQTLKLPLPRLHSEITNSVGPTILIYGGATATGMFGLQFARLSGCRVLTTCSPRNFQLVKALGAHEAFDYHDGEACAAAIRAATSDSLLYALDCVSAGSSLQICADALTSRPDEALYTAALPIGDKFPRQDVQHGWTSGYTAFGEMTHLAGKLRPANMVDFTFAADFWKIIAELLRQDRLRLGPLVHRREGGLTEIPKGLSELRSGRVTAGKLVYRI
ncbi:GroES-like protein [Biscogniauxia marginata]|nr:GroES-like protein [Biscogniauxia marginata]